MRVLQKSREFMLSTGDRAAVTAVILDWLATHRVTWSHLSEVSPADRPAYSIIEFTAGLFAGIYKWDPVMGISSGRIKVEHVAAEPTLLRVTCVLNVRSALFIAAMPPTFVAVVLASSRQWVVAILVIIIALPVFFALLAEGYVGSFKQSIEKALAAALFDPTGPRGFDVLRRTGHVNGDNRD